MKIKFDLVFEIIIGLILLTMIGIFISGSFIFAIINAIVVTVSYEIAERAFEKRFAQICLAILLYSIIAGVLLSFILN